MKWLIENNNQWSLWIFLCSIFGVLFSYICSEYSYSKYIWDDVREILVILKWFKLFNNNAIHDRRPDELSPFELTWSILDRLMSIQNTQIDENGFPKYFRQHWFKSQAISRTSISPHRVHAHTFDHWKITIICSIWSRLSINLRCVCFGYWSISIWSYCSLSADGTSMPPHCWYNQVTVVNVIYWTIEKCTAAREDDETLVTIKSFRQSLLFEAAHQCGRSLTRIWFHPAHPSRHQWVCPMNNWTDTMCNGIITYGVNGDKAQRILRNTTR